MIAEELWNGAFHRDPQIAGKTIVLEGKRFTVAGIVPSSYRGTNLNWSDSPQIWILLQSAPLALPRLKAIDILHHRDMRWLLMLGRLRAGATVQQAGAEIQLLAAQMAGAEPATNRDITAFAFPASRSKFWPAYRAPVAKSFAILGAGAALVLLLACANVSNLLLERGLGRRREIAIRLSIGAARGRLIRQLFVENLLLALLSFLAALLVAGALEKVLLHFPNAFGIPLSLGLTAETRVLALCFSISLAAILLFGLAPALQTTRPDLLPALKESGGAISATGSDWLRNSLVVVQVALSLVLLVGGGLFARSLLKAYSADLGFRSQNLLTMAFDLAPNQNSGASGQEFVRVLTQRISNLPGVESATVSRELPLTMMRSSIEASAEPQSGSSPVSADYNVVGPAYLSTMGIALVAGRDFTSADDANSAKVAVVNRTLAERLWSGRNSVGRLLRLKERGGHTRTLEVVGVARDAKYNSVWEQPQPYLYLPAAQSNFAGGHLLVRTLARPETLIPAIRRGWDRLAPRVPLYDIHTGDQDVNLSLAPQRLAAGLLGAFGALAILLASIGLYSLTAYSVIRRTREIGIRIAIGARPEIVVREILVRALRLATAGTIIGLFISLALMHLIASQVKDVSPYDPATFAIVVFLLLLVSFAAAILPAVRASRTDPLSALKCE